VVRRYSRPPYNIKFWELFNEPDGTKPLYGAAITTWGYYGKDYALMLKAAYPAIKAADPDSQLVFGGLAYGNFTDDPDANNGNFYRNFLNVVLWHGAGEYFDYMNFHYYYFARDVWGDITGKISHLEEMMAGHGVEKPMICTEVGIWGYDEPYYLTLQARYLPRVFVRGFSEGLETVLWFPLATEEGHTFEGGLIREEDLSEKPAFISYQVMAAELADHRYRRELETGSTLLEGYEFVSSATGKSKLIIWAQDGESDYYAVTAERIRVAGIGGNQAIIVDGSGGDYDGENNGRVLISVTASPVYVQEW